MKILYITGMYPTPEFPQQGIFCHEQVKALKAQGQDVTVIVPIPFYDRAVKVKTWEYEGVQIRYVRFFKLPGVRDFHRTGKALYKRLKKAVNLQEFDVYHADAPLPAGYAVMLASEKYNTPFVVHAHGLDVFSDVDYKEAKNCKKIVDASALVYEKANAIAGVSRKTLDNIQARVDINGKDFVVYNGVDVEAFLPNPQKAQPLKLISIGNLIPLKGHDYTLRALRRFVDAGYTDVECTIVGRGYLMDDLKALAKELDIEKYVRFLGYIPYENVAKALGDSDVFVLPSYYEALGCVYLEAMSCGLPTIGCYGNGIDEIIEDGKNGFLVEPKNVDALVKCFIALTEKELRENIGRTARESVIDHYQWMHSAKSLVEIYEALIDEKGKNVARG